MSTSPSPSCENRIPSWPGRTVPLVYNTQPLKSQILINSLYFGCLAGDCARQPAGGHDYRVGAHLLPDPVDDPLYEGWIAEEDPRLHGRNRVLPDHGRRLDDLYPRQFRRLPEERLGRDAGPRGDDSAHVVPAGRDVVERRGGAEVEDNARLLVFRIRGDGVDDPVGADLLRVVHLDGDAGLHARPDDQGCDAEVAHAQIHDRRRERRDDGGDDDRIDLPGGEMAAVVEVPDEDPVLVARLLLVGPDAPVMKELLSLVHPQDRMRVPDVYDEQHDMPFTSRTR